MWSPRSFSAGNRARGANARTAPRRCAAALLLAALVTNVYAADLEAYLEPERGYVGQPVRVVLSIVNYTTADEPVAPTVDGAILLAPAGPSEQSSTVYDGLTGRTTRRVARTYHYTLIPERTGTIEVPPFEVRVDGELRRTATLQLPVGNHDLGEVLRATITLSEPRVYVGQRVRATLTIWVKAPRWGNQILSLDAVRERLRAGDISPFPARVAERRTGTPPGVPGDQLWYAYDLVAELQPDRPGPLLFRNIVVGVDYPTNRGTWNLLTSPEAPEVEVLPIPMEQRPANFSGAVGVFNIETRAHPTSIRVGDPVRLTIEIYGDGELATLPPPLLESDPEFNRHFRLPTEPLAGEVVNGRRRYQVTIRPISASAREIPPVEYPHFDPLAGRFVVARSGPIPLAVEAVETVTLPEFDLPPRNGTPELAGRDGLRDIEVSEHRLLATTFRPTPILVAALATAPPALFALAWAGAALQRRNTAQPQRGRARGALRTAHRRLRSLPVEPPAAAHAIALALADYLAQRSGEPPGRASGTAAVDTLRSHGAPPDLVARWQSVCTACEQAAFAGGDIDPAELRREALEVLHAVEGLRW